jgi:signal transduction histidine kinase
VTRGHFSRIAEVFYARILEHEGARTALEGGESQVGHLKGTLQIWMDQLLRGPWDESYFELRCRIGRMHVRIALPQHYMFGAMNVLRQEFNALIDEHYRERPQELARVRRALSKILDLELAIMLHTYREDLLAQQARSERLSTFGQLVGSIGHELRNPLGVIETSLFILKSRQTPGDERTAKHLGRIGEQVTIANRIVSDLLDMIRDKPLKAEPVRLEEVWRSAVSAVEHHPEVLIEEHGLTELPEVRGDPHQLR